MIGGLDREHVERRAVLRRVHARVGDVGAGGGDRGSEAGEQTRAITGVDQHFGDALHRANARGDMRYGARFARACMNLARVPSERLFVVVDPIAVFQRIEPRRRIASSFTRQYRASNSAAFASPAMLSQVGAHASSSSDRPPCSAASVSR